MANVPKKTLSKNLTQMKFMRRHLANQDVTETDGLLTEKWIVPGTPPTVVSRTEKIEVLDGFMEFEGLNRLGRMSFKGFNKEVEMMVRSRDRFSEEAEEEGVSVSAKEMAERYSTLIDSGHILGKRRRGETKPAKDRKQCRSDSSGFLKPA